MPGQPIYTGQTGNPRDARIRMAPQATHTDVTGGGQDLHVGVDASYCQGNVYGGEPVRTRGEITDLVLSPAGKPLDGLEGKWAISNGPLAFGTLDPGNPLQFIAWASSFGFYTYGSPYGTGTGYLVNNSPGPYAIGTTSIDVNTGSGTVLANDVVMFTGDTNKYTVVSSTGGGTVTNVVIAAPGLLATLAHSTAMTISAYHTWRFGLSESTAVVPAVSMQWNDQVNPITTFAGVLFHGFSTGATPNSPYAMTCPFGVHAFSEFGAVTQTVGSSSTLPVIIGTFDSNWAAAATDADLYIKIVNASTKTLATKIGSASSYGPARSYTLGTKNRLYDQTGARIGDPHEQVRAFWPTGATLTTNDVFKVPARRAAWSESLPTRRPISSVNIAFVVEGEEIPIPGGVTTTNGWDQIYNTQDTPGAQGAIIQNDGSFVSTINPTRRITDLLFEKNIRVGGFVSVVIDAVSSTLIGNTLRNFRVLIAYPRCLVTGALFATDPGGVNKNESPALIAKAGGNLSYDGYTFTDPCTVLVETDVASTAITGLSA
jgi:hypothetical protein